MEAVLDEPVLDVAAWAAAARGATRASRAVKRRMTGRRIVSSASGASAVRLTKDSVKTEQSLG
jgi:hypothetical protein